MEFSPWALRIKGELVRISRDGMLLLFMFLSPLICVLFRFLWPLAAGLLSRYFGFDLAPYAPLMSAIVIQMPASMIGTAAGFLILEDRDEKLFAPLSVAPGGLNGYLSLRIALFCLLAFLEALLVRPLLGLPRSGADSARDALACLAAAPLCALYALFLGSVARDKLEGMSLGKLLSLLDFGAFLAWYAKGPACAASFLIPSFAPAKAALSADSASSLAWTLASIAYIAVLTAVCWRTCERRAAAAGGF